MIKMIFYEEFVKKVEGAKFELKDVENKSIQDGFNCQGPFQFG